MGREEKEGVGRERQGWEKRGRGEKEGMVTRERRAAMDVQRRYWLLAYERGAWSVAFGLPLPQLLRGKRVVARARGRPLKSGRSFRGFPVKF